MLDKKMKKIFAKNLGKSYSPIGELGMTEKTAKKHRDFSLLTKAEQRAKVVAGEI